MNKYTKKGHNRCMFGIAGEEQSNPVELKNFRDTTGANVVADATPDADQTLRSRSPVPHYPKYV